jgi:thiosulfate dehydrogenase [quinone] large subunit
MNSSEVRGDHEMAHRDARYLAAALQGIIGWEWLVSGTNKVLSGSFPRGLAGALMDGSKGNPNSWYVAILQAVVIPHGILFGYLIETVEVLSGLALLAGALLLLGGVRRKGEPHYRLALGQVVAAAVAALACVFLCVNFHFFAGDGVIPGVRPAAAFNEGIDLDTLMAPLALLIFGFNAYVFSEMRGVSLLDTLKRGMDRARVWRGARRGAASAPAERATLAA